MKTIVLSGVNLAAMGPISVYKDALQVATQSVEGRYEIVAIVHRKNLFSIPGVRYIEFPHVKKSWLRRLWFEYVQLRSLSKRLDADLWVSMHDMSPNIQARRRAVYCHNPSPFYRLQWRDALRSWRFVAFVLFYKYLYRINIKRNDAVIVQQAWIRSEFEKEYGLNNVVVAHPEIEIPMTGDARSYIRAKDGCYRFFYPSFPRHFKNFEVILNAVDLLEKQSIGDFEVWLTCDASTSAYARALTRKFRHLRRIRWLGTLDRAIVLEKYLEADCLLFMSKLETWGLPISEFKITGRPMILADLPYARETVGAYDQVSFVGADNPSRLAEVMRGAIVGEKVFAKTLACQIASPYARNWRELWMLLLSDAEVTSGRGQSTPES